MADELLEQIALAPVEEEAELLRVYADQLILRGDPLGELLVVASDRLHHDSPELRRREAALVDEQERAVRRALEFSRTSFAWQRGLLDRIRFQHAGESLEHVLPRLAARPEARLLRRLEIREGEGDLAWVFPVLARLAPAFPRLAELAVHTEHEAWADGSPALGDVSPLYATYPRLACLELEGDRVELGAIALPALRRLLATNLVADDARRIVAGELPLLADLELHFKIRSVDNIAASFGPLLHREREHLEALSLTLPSPAAQLWMVRELPEAPIARRLRRLRFRRGLMDARCHEVLLADRARYPRLERLELAANNLPATLQQQLRRAYGDVLVLA